MRPSAGACATKATTEASCIHAAACPARFHVKRGQHGAADHNRAGSVARSSGYWKVGHVASLFQVWYGRNFRGTRASKVCMALSCALSFVGTLHCALDSVCLWAAVGMILPSCRLPFILLWNLPVARCQAMSASSPLESIGMLQHIVLRFCLREFVIRLSAHGLLYVALQMTQLAAYITS